jgi:gamma-glutamyl:cysteine ligase YbdK (ATP-grasp superfamily)
LPDAFETEIQNTEVKGQDINTANAELLRDRVMFETSVKVAKLAVNATVETAYGQGNKTYYAAMAEASTISDVIKAQSTAYKYMKANLTFDNDQVTKYLQNSLVKDYGTGKMTISVDL